MLMAAPEGHLCGRSSSSRAWWCSFAMLVALGLMTSTTRPGSKSSAALVGCLVLAGLLRRSWALTAGSALQVLIIGTGVVVPTMYFLGALFAGLWFLAIFLGRRVERMQAAARTEPDGG